MSKVVGSYLLHCTTIAVYDCKVFSGLWVFYIKILYMTICSSALHLFIFFWHLILRNIKHIELLPQNLKHKLQTWSNDYILLLNKTYDNAKPTFNPILPGGAIMAPLPWIRLLLSHGQGYVNQTSWFRSFPYLPGPRKPVLVFVFQKIEKIGRPKFLGVLEH